MPTGILAPAGGASLFEQSRLRSLGFRVSIGEGAAARDVTDVVSGLRYSSRLPGGYADCSFALHMPLVEAVGFLQHLAPLRVTFEGSLAWEGRVEEPPRGPVGAEALPVMALGRGAELKAQKFTKIFVTSGYGRWKGAWELISNQTTAPDISSYVGFPPDANVNTGFVFGYPTGATIQPSDDVAWIWVPPAGCEILRVAGSVNAQGTSGALATRLFALSALAGYGGASLETIVATRAMSLGDTTFDDTLSASGAVYLRVESEFTSGAAVTIASPEFWHYHSMKIVGARTAEGDVFDPAQVTSWAVIRSLLAEYGGTAVQSSDEAMTMLSPLPSWLPGASLDARFAWSDLVFETPTTVEEAINRVNGPVGWEWGVFEDGLFYYGPIQTITTLGREDVHTNLGDVHTPPWWLSVLAQDGHRVTLAQSLTDIVNEVRVYYTDAQGVQQVSYASDFGNAANPLNQRDGSGPRQRRTGTVDLPGTSDAATAASVASAYLAQYSRPQVKGEITWNGLRVPRVAFGDGSRGDLPGSQSKQVMSTPLIRPGHWVEVGDAVGLIDVSWQTLRNPQAPIGVPDRGTPPALLPIRSVEVNADAGQVTCAVDSSRDVLGVALARLAA